MAKGAKGASEITIDAGEWRVLEDSYGLHGHDKSPEEIAAVPLCDRPKFEMFIGAAIVVNALIMALELDLSNKDAGFEEKMPWVITDILFCTLFAWEISFRIWCLGLTTFLSEWRLLADGALVALNIADTSIQISGGGTSGLQSLSALRVLRLFKLMKVFRIVSHVKELTLIATGLMSALKSLQYVSLLLGLVIFVMAIMFKILVGHQCHSPELEASFVYHFPGVDPGEKCEEFWGTVLRAMYTLYQVTTLESWSQVIARPIWDVYPHYIIFILVFQLISTFGLLNIVVAAVVDGTMNSSDELVVENAAMRESSSHLQTLREIFLLAADPGSMRVTAERLIPVLTRADIRRKLLLLQISYDDPNQIFRILDSKEEKAIAFSDFTTGFMRMRGNAKSKDLLGIRAQIYRAEHNLTAKIDGLGPPSGGAGNGKPNIDKALAEISDKMDSMAAVSRDGIGRLSEEMGKKIGGFSEEIRGKFESLERQIDRAASTGVQQPFLRGVTPQQSGVMSTPLAASHLSSPVHLTLEMPGAPSAAPRPQQSEAIWEKLCSTPVGGHTDRQSVAKRMVELVRPTAPLIQESTELQAILARDHESLVWQLDEKHKVLLSRLGVASNFNGIRGNGPTNGSDRRSLPRLTEEATLPAASDAQAEMSAASEMPVKLESKEIKEQSKAPVSSVMVTEAKSAQNDACAQPAEANRSDNAQMVPSARPLVPDVPPAGAASEQRAQAKAPAELEKPRNSSIAKARLEVVDDSISGRFAAFVTGPVFETTFAFLITLNAFVMATETQYYGIDTGFKIGFPGSRASAKDTWPGAESVFHVLEIAFGTAFVFELVVKVAALRVRFLFSWWNWLDTVIVGSWLLESGFNVKTFLNPMMLRLFRLVKLLRVAKLFKTFQAFDSLSLLIHSLKASASILFWSIVVIFVLQMIAALFFSQVLQDHMTESGTEKTRHEVYEHFGTFTRSFVTMLELTIGQWGPICHVLVENVSEWYAIFVIIYVLLVSFATIKVISAVFILETQKLASTDEEILIMQKDRQNSRLDDNIGKVFSEIDVDGTGNMDWEEFEAVLHDHRVMTWMAALDLEVQHCEGLFALMDDGDGCVTFKEFVEGVRRLKGPAKSVDLIGVASQLANVLKTVKRLDQALTTQADTSAAEDSTRL